MITNVDPGWMWGMIVVGAACFLTLVIGSIIAIARAATARERIGDRQQGRHR